MSDSKIDPLTDKAYALYNEGVMHAVNKKLEMAITLFSEALKILPEFEDAIYNRAVALQNLGRLKEAIDDFRKVIEINPDSIKTRIRIGSLHGYFDNFEGALREYNYIVKLAPDNSMIWSYREVVLQKLGKYPEAIRSHSKAIKIDPRYAHAHYNLACSLALMGDVQGSLEELRFAIRMDGTDKYFRKALEDADFTPIRHIPEFQDFFYQIS
ncbi:MAG: tetratricopeptide repeat protein [Candidatus Heimdallarchaeota archaeon]|nr:tetratricopeptide repeat protein [Candidatus Heimdallarchaeota archaeon]